MNILEKINRPKQILLLLALSSLLFSCSLTDNERKFVREGNALYKDSVYDEAEISYRKAVEENPKSFAAHYNIANTFYQKKKHKEAAEKYAKLTDSLSTPKWRGDVNHNLGNALLHGQEIDKAIEAYKEALRNTPTDLETKYNLAYAMALKEQQEQQEQQQQQDQQQDQQSGEGEEQEQEQNKQDQQSQDQESESAEEEQKDHSAAAQAGENKDGQEEKGEEEKPQNEEKGDNQDEGKPEEEEQGTPQPTPQQDEKGEEKAQEVPAGITKEDAERILDALAEDEKETQEKAKEADAKKVRKTKSNKDW